MHSVIQIACFVVLALGLSLGGSWHHLAAGAAVVVCAYALAPVRGLAPLLKAIARLRWLWLSLFILYFWLTPGSELLPSWGVWSPTSEGVQEGLVRVGILALLAASANLLWHMSGRESLLGAIHWLARPLRLVRVSPERFALRLVLVLQAVPNVRPSVPTRAPRPQASLHGRLGRIAGSVSELLTNALRQAEAAPLHEVVLTDSGRPPHYQWLLPAALAVAFWLL